MSKASLLLQNEDCSFLLSLSSVLLVIIPIVSIRVVAMPGTGTPGNPCAAPFLGRNGQMSILASPKSNIPGIVLRLYMSKILNMGFAESFKRRFQCWPGVSFGSRVCF